MHRKNSYPEPHTLLKLTFVFFFAFAFAVIDLFLELPKRSAPHMSLHAGSILLFLWGTISLFRRWMAARVELSGTRGTMRDLSTERDAWKERAVHFQEGLGQAIDEQMDAWQLTETEKSTALMLLKGYSHKEIAQLADRSERTVRQHAVAVYRKSGLHGRAELSAFFLEDLLVPVADRESAEKMG